ncbi:hypothetical protein [Haloferula sp. BvORR071]|uniref:hypothetical protein n=1 Tax=Haloferula sp. BvORR071 TaxID=1396141 RepID=UPI000550F3D2|nr:hypothetical protein [Haloferula sp. BvORR071]
MKPPTTPLRFQTAHRTHPRQTSRAGAWDSWVGGSEVQSTSLFFKMFLVLAAVAMIAGALFMLR